MLTVYSFIFAHQDTQCGVVDSMMDQDSGGLGSNPCSAMETYWENGPGKNPSLNISPTLGFQLGLL